MTNKPLHIISLILCVSLGLIASACDVHEFFGNNSNDADNFAKNSRVLLNLNFDTTWPFYRDIEISRAAQTYDMQYLVKVYRKNIYGDFENTEYCSKSFINNDITNINRTIELSLPNGSYRIIAWADYVAVNDADNTLTSFFNTDDIRSVSINSTKAVTGNTDMTDSFRAVSHINVDTSRGDDIVNMAMHRPMAKYQIIATDVDEFANNIASRSHSDVINDLQNGSYKIKVDYSGFVPTEYDVVADFVADAQTQLGYNGQFTLLADNEALLAFDYVFVNTTGSSVDMSVSIANSSGTVVHDSGKFSVPLMQGMLTVVRGNFLTANSGDSSGGGGLGIVPDFEGPDFNIRI